MHDLVLRGGTVYDGLGSPGRVADVAVDGDEVTVIGRDVGDARRVIDADGLAVAPGFIDPHAHSDAVPLMDAPQPFKLHQGVTTEIVGNCGFSLAPLSEGSAAYAQRAFGDLGAGAQMVPGSFADYFARTEAAGPTNHIAALVGHGALRLTANGLDRDLREGALEEMCRLADEAFAAGAIGFSTGLIYVPGAYSDTDEIVAIATVAQRWQRIYASHMRDEGLALAQALDEAIEIGRRAGVRVQISHCKAAGRSAHGASKLLLEKLHDARVEGIDVRGDQYPYLAGATFLVALLPPSSQEGGIEALLSRLADREVRAQLRELTEGPNPTGAGLWGQTEPGDVLVVRHVDERNIGKTLEQIAGDKDAWEVACDLISQDSASMMVISLMDEDDVRTIMADPLVSIGSDSGVPVGMDHQRTWGCFPRFLGAYVREAGVVSWEEAIRKMTSSTARQFGLRRRGWLGPGAVADICVFDPNTVGHPGTYLEPAVKPTGIEHVLLAGSVVVESGEFTGQRKGRMLRAGIGTGE